MLATSDCRYAVKVDSRNRVSHLFFALTEALEIFKAIPDVILMVQHALLNIVGVSGMNSTIHVAQAFLHGEAFEDYHWVLTQLRHVMSSESIDLPQVILVDRVLALLNALEVMFPSVPVLLCLWHVVKDVESHARKHALPQVLDEETSTRRTPKWKDSQEHRAFCDGFIAVVKSSTQEEFSLRRQELHRMSPSEAQYIDEVWLDIWKCRIVRCWTNSILHFGLQATSRIEGYHASLKRWLCSSRGDLLTLHTRMQHWWRLSIEKYRDAVSDSQVKVLSLLRGRLFASVARLIQGFILKKGILFEEYETSSCCLKYTREFLYLIIQYSYASC